MSLLFCEQTHLCEFGENFGGGAAMAKSLFITFPRAMAAPPPKFSSSKASLLEDKQARSPRLNPRL